MEQEKEKKIIYVRWLADDEWWRSRWRKMAVTIVDGLKGREEGAKT